MKDSNLPALTLTSGIMMLATALCLYRGNFIGALLPWSAATVVLPAVAEKRGHSVGSALVETADFLGSIYSDCSELVEASWRSNVRHKAVQYRRAAASSLGLLTDEEIRGLDDATPQIVTSPAGIFELILGTQAKPANTALLAFRGSGKSTLLHGVIHHLVNHRSGSIILVGDPNYGTVNPGSRPLRWGFFPIFNPIEHDPRDLTKSSHICTTTSTIFTLIAQANSLYHARMRANESRAVRGEDALAFTPVYLFIDEFLTVFKGLSEGAQEMVVEAFGNLIRASKYQIFFYPVLHNDKAIGGLPTALMSDVNLLVLGNYTQNLKGEDSLRNSAKRFSDGTQQIACDARGRFELTHSAPIAEKMVGVIDIKTAISSSFGSDYGVGNHVIRVPDCTELVDVPFTDDPWIPGLSGATAMAEDTPPIGEGTRVEFQQFIREHWEAIVAAGNVSPSAFARAFPGWTSQHRGERWALLKQLAVADATGGLITPATLERFCTESGTA